MNERMKTIGKKLWAILEWFYVKPYRLVIFATVFMGIFLLCMILSEEAKRGDKNFSYSGGDKERYIVGYKGSEEKVVIPKKTGNFKIEGIADWGSGFRNKGLISVEFPMQSSHFKTIGDRAFSDNQLTSIEIPVSVETIGKYAFSNNQLTSVNFHGTSKLITIGDNAFSGNKLTSIEIPDSVETIGGYAFAHNQLTSVKVLASVKVIGDHAFYNNQLASVEIPDSVESIGDNAFSNNQLTSIIIPISVKTIGENAFSNNRLISVTLPDNVDISTNSFGSSLYYKYINNERRGATYTTSLSIIDDYDITTLDNSTVEITKYTGNNKEVVIPRTLNGLPVTAIGDGAFSDESLELSLGRYFVLTKGARGSIEGYDYEENRLISVVIPDTVKTIGTDAFYNKRLTSVVIGNSVEIIENGAFSGNDLTAVILPDSLKTIESGVFSGNRLTSVVIGNSVKAIGWGAFSGNHLTRVFIPNSVRSIEANAFSRNRLTSVVIGNSVETIGKEAFSGNKLTTVIIPNSVTSIEYGAFQNNQLTNIDIPISVNVIKDYAFENNQLTSIVIPNSVKTIGSRAFYRNNLNSIIIPKNVDISLSSFNCLVYGIYKKNNTQKATFSISSSTSGDFEIIVVNNSFVEITKYTGSEKNVVVPETINGLPVISIGTFAFHRTELESVFLPNSIEIIGSSAFSFNQLSSVLIPDSVMIIGENAFIGNQITNVVIPASVKSLAERAFWRDSLKPETNAEIVYRGEKPDDDGTLY